MCQNTLLKDVVKHENQIPIFVLKELLSTITSNASNSSSSSIHHNHSLSSMLIDLCKVLSPLPLHETYLDQERRNPRHLLDLLYHLLWLKGEESQDDPIAGGGKGAPHQKKGSYKHGKISDKEEEEETVVTELWKDVKDSNNETVEVVTKPICFVLRVCDLFGITKFLRKVLEEEKVMIPTASKLNGVGIRFSASNGGLRRIHYNKSSKVLSLPVFTWKPTSEVVMRNAVAYEVIAKSQSLILPRYMGLMNGLIRSPEDVELLKKVKIIVGDVDSHEEVIEEINTGDQKDGNNILEKTSSSIYGGDMTILDEEIRRVNEYYDSNREVKLSKIFKKYVRFSTKVFVYLAAMLFLLFLANQTLCDVIPSGLASN